MTGMGGAISRPDEFNVARWTRIGADESQLDDLREAFDALTYDQRVAENSRIASLPDGDLRAELVTGDEPAASVTPLGAQPPQSLADAGLPSGAGAGADDVE